MGASPKITNKKERILASALKIFAEKGSQEATISEISEAAGVSDATIYGYFQSKENLLFSIPEVGANKALDSLAKILPFVKGTENKIRAIVQVYLTTYQEGPDYASVVMLGLKANRKFHSSKSFEPIRELARQLLETIKEGIDSGVFTKELDPYLMRSMILGTIEHSCISRYLREGGDLSNITNDIDPIMALVLNGARVKQNTMNLNINLQISEGKITSKKITAVKK